MSLDTLLWYGNVAASVGLLVAMLRGNLVSRYPALFSYLATDVLQQLLGIAVTTITGSRGGIYFYIYTIGQSAKLLLSVWIVFELMNHALASHPALLRFARQASAATLGIAVMLSLGTLWLTPPRVAPGRGWTLPYFLAFERSFDLALLIVLLVLAGFIAWFPMRLSRNTAYYLAGYVSYFLMRWIAINSQSFAPSVRREINAGMLMCSMLSLFALSLWLSKRGEQETVVPGHGWNPEAMERLRVQMDTLNANLGRARPQA